MITVTRHRIEEGVVDQRASVPLVHERERLGDLRKLWASRCSEENAQPSNLKRLTDASALDNDVVEATTIGQCAHLHSGLNQMGAAAPGI